MGLKIAGAGAFVRALDAASQVDLTSYRLPLAAGGRAGSVLAALERAGDRGAHVRVRLEGTPYRRGATASERANQHVVEALRAHGVDADLAAVPGAPLHMKAAVIDGRLFLDDRNWLDNERDTVLTSDDPADIAAIRSAMAGRPTAGAILETRKGAALTLEADTIGRAPPGPIEVASESFGRSSVGDAILAREASGSPVRLLVGARDSLGNARELAELKRLAAAGVEIRVAADGGEKLCLTGSAAWVGSANATNGFLGGLDWGLRTDAAPVLDALHAKFEANWCHAHSLRLLS